MDEAWRVGVVAQVDQNLLERSPACLQNARVQLEERLGPPRPALPSEYSFRTRTPNAI